VWPSIGAQDAVLLGWSAIQIYVAPEVNLVSLAVRYRSLPFIVGKDERNCPVASPLDFDTSWRVDSTVFDVVAKVIAFAGDPEYLFRTLFALMDP